MSKDDQGKIVADIKNGFIKIPNLLFEALLLANLIRTQKDICDYLLRRSYGWNQKEASASINEIADTLNIDRSWIAKQLRDLLRKNVIIRIGNQSDNTAVYQINIIISDWDSSCIDLDQLKNINNSYPIIIMKEQNTCGSTDQQPNLFAEQLVVSATTPLVVSTTTPPVVSTTTPDHAPPLVEPQSQAAGNTYLNTNKDNTFIYSEHSTYFSLAKLLLDRILMNYPNFKIPDLQKWALIIHRMIRYDKRDPEIIRKVIIFAQEDDFWISHILSTKKLRAQFDTLDIQRVRKDSRKRSSSRKAGDKDEYDFFFNK